MPIPGALIVRRVPPILPIKGDTLTKTGVKLTGIIVWKPSGIPSSKNNSIELVVA
jgi:hypothetical protein